MDKELIDKLWNKATRKTLQNGELNERYHFAKLVAAHEREACAKFCEINQVWVGGGKRGFTEWGHEEFVTGGRHQGMDYAAAIRARGFQ